MPDLLIHGGPIYTLDPRTPQVDALLIRDDRIIAAGTAAEIASSLQGKYEDISLDGRAVLPGLTDAHIHLLWTGLGRSTVDLDGIDTLEETLERVRAHADRLPADAWVRGHGWNHALWEHRWPTAADLDRVTAGRPAILSRKDGHSVWLNSRALQLAAIDRDTAEPSGGTIGRDEHGEPTGILSENANSLGYRAVPDYTWAERRHALHRIIIECNRRGLTSLHIPEGPDTLALLRELREQNDLTIRTLWHIPYAHLDQAIALGIRSGLGDEWVRIGGVKIFGDGSLGSCTCHMLAPFNGTPHNYGIPTIPEEELYDAVFRAERAGIASTIHAIGDRANRTVLDAIAAARSRRNKDSDALHSPALPHRIEHAQHLNPADIARFAQLGVIASMQPIHATSDYLIAERLLGAERSAWSYAWRPLLDAGATLAFGSDAPVETLDPWAGLHAAITRQRANGEPPGGWHPELALSRDEALAAYTVGPATSSGESAIKGTLTVGKLADLVVLGADPFTAEPQELRQMEVEMTIVGGRVLEF